MRRLAVGVLLVGLAGGCASLGPGPAAAPAPAAVPPPASYQVVYRDRGTWVDPAFVAIERRGEYLLEEQEIWEGRW